MTQPNCLGIEVSLISRQLFNLISKNISRWKYELWQTETWRRIEKAAQIFTVMYLPRRFFSIGLTKVSLRMPWWANHRLICSSLRQKSPSQFHLRVNFFQAKMAFSFKINHVSEEFRTPQERPLYFQVNNSNQEKAASYLTIQMD